MFTAHYDHLGGMGSQTYFPGANDNASGVSLLLNMARHYAANPAPYSMAFICFAAEEAGLLGSKHFTEQPLIDLKKIRFLVNLDMIGTGDTGITVVNAEYYPKEFTLLNEINDQHKYLSKINPRGKAANSDHYFFSEKGVPSFFIYTNGGIKAYHDVNDLPGTLPFTEYDDLFNLFLNFNKKLTE
ncbi:Aminopeptidase YwaD precursor [compost metagenome]